jgi:ribonucleotide monophosphatase NagD (HAD superfamily)
VEYSKHLREIGLDVADHEMMTAATAAADYIALKHPGATVLTIGDVGLDDALKSKGIEQAHIGGAAAQVVLIGAADQYTSKSVNAACLAIADHGAACYVTVNLPWFHGGNQRSVAMSSAIGRAVASITGCQPQVCGKPSQAIGDVLRTRLGGPDRQLVVIGDQAKVEVRLARQMGALGILA